MGHRRSTKNKMKILPSDSMIGGWFVGNFEPTAYKTDQFEVSYKIHKEGEKWPAHYHKAATEINYLISGQMTIQKKTLKSGDIFILYPYEVADPTFQTECRLIVVKTPGKPDDKFEV